MNLVGENIKNLRQCQAMSQETLAEKLHITRQTISSWETGRTEPDIQMLKHLSELLHTDMETLTKSSIEKGIKAKRKRRLKTQLAICIFAIIVIAVLIVVWKPVLAMDAKRYFNSKPYLLFLTLVEPILYFSVAFGTVSVFLYLKPLLISRKKRLQISLIVLLLILLHICTMLLPMAPFDINAVLVDWYMLYLKLGSPMILALTGGLASMILQE